MSDHNERSCTQCGSLLHHESRCPKAPSAEPLSELAGPLCSSALAPCSARFVWCAEAPNFPRYYAAKEPVMHGKLGEKGGELGTYNFWAAHHFATKAECEEWITKNSPPEWTATEHGIG